MFMKYIFIFLLISISLFLPAQTMITATEFDLGEIDQLNEEVLDLNITNNSGQKVFLLRIEHTNSFEVKYTSKTFQENEAQIVRLKYRPKKKGKFSEEVNLYFSSNTEPISITIKGEILTVPKNLLQACPDFNNRETYARPTVTDLRQDKAEIKRQFVNLLPNNTLETEVVKEEILAEVTPVKMPKEIIPPLAIEVKGEPKVIIAEVEAIDPEPLVIPTSTKPNELSRNEFKPNNIIFLIDASMSMGKNDKLELLKSAIIELLTPLREIDKIAIVTYKNEAKIVLPSTTADNKQLIRDNIDSVLASGFTAGNKGLIKAYEVANESFIEGGNNQIYLVTDGAFIIGEKNERTPRMIQEGADKGIYITTVGIKNERWTEKNLKGIAKSGNGSYLKLDSFSDIGALLNRVKEQSTLGE
jgi:Mg-chelatase subunit ChlD